MHHQISEYIVRSFFYVPRQIMEFPSSVPFQMPRVPGINTVHKSHKGGDAAAQPPRVTLRQPLTEHFHPQLVFSFSSSGTWGLQNGGKGWEA